MGPFAVNRGAAGWWAFSVEVGASSNRVTVRRSQSQQEAPVGKGTAWWFGASGFEVIGSVHGEFEVQIEVQSTVTVVGCGGCGTRAVAKDRRWVTVQIGRAHV